MLGDLDGLIEDEGEVEGDLDGLLEAEGETEGDLDGLIEPEGEVETEGEREGLILAEGLVETEGEVLTDGDRVVLQAVPSTKTIEPTVGAASSNPKEAVWRKPAPGLINALAETKAQSNLPKLRFCKTSDKYAILCPYTKKDTFSVSLN